MSRSVENLDSFFMEKHLALVTMCNNEGINLVTFFTTRDPWTQAKLWRQDKTSEHISKAIEFLKDEKAFFLADVLNSVGVQYGRWATDCLPGQSYHQLGLASDNCIKVGNKFIWNEDDEFFYLYDRYSEIAESLGLTCGHTWKKKDSYHIQLGKGDLVDTYGWAGLDQIMKVKWQRRSQ